MCLNRIMRGIRNHRFTSWFVQLVGRSVLLCSVLRYQDSCTAEYTCGTCNVMSLSVLHKAVIDFTEDTEDD
jgi:hypothetical protein